MLEARPDLTQKEIAKRAKMETSAVTRMLQGKLLTIANLDALLPAMESDWHELIDVARGDYRPRDLRADLAEAVAELADMRRARRKR